MASRDRGKDSGSTRARKPRAERYTDHATLKAAVVADVTAKLNAAPKGSKLSEAHLYLNVPSSRPIQDWDVWPPPLQKVADFVRFIDGKAGRGLTDLEVALLAIARGYYPTLAVAASELPVSEVVKRVKKSVERAREDNAGPSGGT